MYKSTKKIKIERTLNLKWLRHRPMFPLSEIRDLPRQSQIVSDSPTISWEPGYSNKIKGKERKLESEFQSTVIFIYEWICVFEISTSTVCVFYFLSHPLFHPPVFQPPWNIRCSRVGLVYFILLFLFYNYLPRARLN